MSLTQSQLDKIERNRKTVLPKYFNAVLSAEVEISNEFQSFLILLDDSLKDKAIKFLKESKAANSTRKDRDELLTLAISNELQDASAKLEILTGEMAEFSDFRGNFDISGFESVGEVGLLISDLQAALGETSLSMDRAQHLKTFTVVANSVFNGGKVNDSLLKEMESWIKLITSYQGLA